MVIIIIVVVVVVVVADGDCQRSASWCGDARDVASLLSLISPSCFVAIHVSLSLNALLTHPYLSFFQSSSPSATLPHVCACPCPCLRLMVDITVPRLHRQFDAHQSPNQHQHEYRRSTS